MVANFRRQYSYSIEEYLIAGEPELMQEHAWASSRARVKQTRNDTDGFNNPLGTFAAALTSAERSYLLKYLNKLPDCWCDLAQDLDSDHGYACNPTADPLFTVTAHNGLLLGILQVQMGGSTRGADVHGLACGPSPLHRCRSSLSVLLDHR